MPNKPISFTKISSHQPDTLLPPFLYPSHNKTHQARMTRLIRDEKIRSVGPRLYTSLPESQVAAALKNHWSEVISQLFPEALLSYRSALEYRPSPNGEIYLTANTNRKIIYPGLSLIFIRGPKPLEDDPFFLNFRTSSFPRALLENLSSTKRSKERSLSPSDLEKRLENRLQLRGESDLNQIRDHARIIAEHLNWKSEFQKLEALIGALLGTRSSQNLKSIEAQARAIGRPYDGTRIEKFDLLYSELRQSPPLEKKDPFQSSDHFRNKAFFESYFSNYIEGTTFEIEEAEEIIFQKKLPLNRPQDGHDVLGTFQIVSDLNEMKRTPDSFTELEKLLKKRHLTLMEGRADVLPGEYKEKPNRAGNTHFPAPNLVQGTLEKGFERYLSLEKGFSRALFMMFLISEVHPFTDGNGRIARIMMNAELHKCGLSSIIIPTVYCEDYLLSLRAMTRNHRPRPLVQMLSKAQRISTFDFTSYPKALKFIEDHHWFFEPDEAKLLE